VVLAERIGIPLPRGGEFVVTTMVVATAMLYLPTSAAILAAGLGTLTGETFARKPWYRLLFNVSPVATATGAASLVWRRLWGDGELIPHPDRPEMIPYALAALSIYYLLNTGLVSGVLAISARKNFFRIWRENHRGVFMPHFGMQIMGVLFAGALV